MIFFKAYKQKLLFCIATGIVHLNLPAQPKDFEGALYYHAEVISKREGISDKEMMTLLANTEATTVYIKQGNTRRSNGISDQYYIGEKEKVYIRFKGIDTLYYLDYSMDTSQVLNVSKTGGQKNIAGFDCSAITIETTSGSSTYFYSPFFPRNPEWEKNNTIGQLNVYAKEAGAVWLGINSTQELYSLTETCSRVEQNTVDDSYFKLPDLPEKKYDINSFIKPPEFKRGGGWIKYLESNLNSSLGAKYIKIPKGQSEATQTVQLSYVISKTGEITNINVLNKKEVHSKLAEEAVRVVKEAYGWKPATVFGIKISQLMKQEISFQVSKQ